MGLGEDVLLVAIDRKSGQLRSRPQLDVALAAAELIELALSGQISLVGGQIVVAEEIASDPNADAIVKRLASAVRPTTVSQWLHMRAGAATSACLRALKEARVLADGPKQKREKHLPVSVTDVERLRRATDRFAAVAHSTSDPDGPQVAPADFALAVLVDGVGLTSESLGGLLRHKAKARLAELADQQHSTEEPERSAYAIVRFASRELAELQTSSKRRSASEETWRGDGGQWGGLPQGVGPVR